MPMVADHRRKRLNGASIAGCSSWEQYKIKKKKLAPPKVELNAKSHISLEWDGNRKKVVAKIEQIALSQKDSRAFIDPALQRHSILTDVLSVPREIFKVENLTEVLSYEVWRIHLSENERKYLLQFLPEGSDPEEVVRELLAGNNFHFGNPFLKWGASVCSGNLHPDAIICREKCVKADKKAYYSEMQTYHNDMIKYLQKLKETWEKSSKDPEKEVLLKIWRSRRDAEERTSSHANESRSRDLEEQDAASESCSLVAEEKACSSDNQTSSITKGGELQRSVRIHDRGWAKDKSRKSLVASDDARPQRGEKILKHNIQHNDGGKYMSYLKISKKQHHLVKIMKHSGKSIQSKSLNRVLGNIDMLHVQPYEEFVKEEQNKLQEHWLQLANKDIPAAYENWKKRQFQIHGISKSLEQEIKEKLESEEEEGLSRDVVFQDQNNHGARTHESIVEDKEKMNDEALKDQNSGEKTHESDMEDEEKLNDETVVQDQNDRRASEHEFSEEDQKKDTHDRDLLEDQNDEARNEASYEEDVEVSGSSSPQYQAPQQVSSLSGEHDLKPVDMDSESNYVASESDDISPNASNYKGNISTVDASISQVVPLSSSGDVWPAVSMPQSFYDSTSNHGYASTSALRRPVNEAQRPQLIDLESDVHEEDTGKDLFDRQSHDGSFSYPNHDRSGLLQSLFRGQEMLSYYREQKPMGLDFQSPNNTLIEDGNFTGHLQRQLQTSLPLEQGLKRHGDNYMQRSISENFYSEGGAYLMPRQGHAPSFNPQNSPANPVGLSTRLLPHLNDDVLLTQSWYSGENQVRGSWNSTDNMSVRGQNNADQSLFSVLSECSQLRSSNRFDSMRPPEQFTLPRNYEMATSITSRINTPLPQAPHLLDYLSGRNTTNPVMSDEMGWVTQPQNSGINDPVGKAYLRSWNQ